MESQFLLKLRTWIAFYILMKTDRGSVYVKNPTEAIKKSGVIKLSDGHHLAFNQNNKRDILQIVNFVVSNGIKFGNGTYQWKFDPKNGGIIETHQRIKFHIKGFDSNIFTETFLSQIHFVDFNLKEAPVVTAGAFIGDTPLFHSYYGAKVYAFEPDPYSFRLAEENLSLNPDLAKKIVLKNYAVGNDGEVEFPINESGSGGSSIYGADKVDKTAKVRSISISSILKEFDIKDPYLLDLDIKGAEFEIIKDASISKFKRVRIEYSPGFLNNKWQSLDSLIKTLHSYGFHNIRIYKHNVAKDDLLSHGIIDAMK